MLETVPGILDGFSNLQLHMVKYLPNLTGPVPSAVQIIPLPGPLPAHPPLVRSSSTSQSVSIAWARGLPGHQQLRGLHQASSLPIQ